MKGTFAVEVAPHGFKKTIESSSRSDRRNDRELYDKGRNHGKRCGDGPRIGQSDYVRWLDDNASGTGREGRYPDEGTHEASIWTFHSMVHGKCPVKAESLKKIRTTELKIDSNGREKVIQVHKGVGKSGPVRPSYSS